MDNWKINDFTKVSNVNIDAFASKLEAYKHPPLAQKTTKQQNSHECNIPSGVCGGDVWIICVALSLLSTNVP